MKKVLCMLMALVLAVSLAVPAFAADTFVPSITYKDGPDVIEAIQKSDEEEKDVDDCVVVTTLKQAEEKKTDISQEDRDLLKEVYDALKNGTMKLPIEGDYVVWELFDLSFEYEDCREDEEHGNKDEQLKKQGNTLTVTFKLGIKPTETISVLAYVDGKWVAVEATNNGDGTLTCVFEDICPVVFCREKSATEQAPQTGDTLGKGMILWVAVLVVSAAAIVVLVINRRKFVR